MDFYLTASPSPFLCNEITWYKNLYHTASNICVFLHVGSTLCWGSNVETSYRFYEHGLHLGSAALGNKKCHLANDETEIMLKSHYTRVHETGRSATWDRAQFGFLTSRFLQVPCKRIAIWVR